MKRIEHLNKAAHNENFFKRFDVDTTEFRDWVVVGIFYAALHYYEAYFALDGKHSGTHNKTEKWIKTDDRIVETYFDYRDLKQYRMDASYKDKNFTAKEITDVILPKFDNIKKKILFLS